MNIEQLKNIATKMLHYKGVTPETLFSIENSLAIKLPEDFKTIAYFYEGNHFSLINDFAISAEVQTNNIVSETLKLRKSINLPKNFILLAKPAQSFILLDTENTPQIIWCNAKDIENLSTRNFKTNPYTRETYSDFFDEMLRIEYQKYIEKKTEELQNKQNNHLVN